MDLGGVSILLAVTALTQLLHVSDLSTVSAILQTQAEGQRPLAAPIPMLLGPCLRPLHRLTQDDSRLATALVPAQVLRR